jgi:cytidyltransferase-like protein
MRVEVVSLLLLTAASFLGSVEGFATSSLRCRQQWQQSCIGERRPQKRIRDYQCSLNAQQNDKYQHTLAILSMPSTSTDKIANEAILNQAVQRTHKLSVVLRAQGDKHPSLARLRRYVGEVYSTLWDVAMASGTPDFCDVVVYPQNLPNAAPERWIHHASDLDSVCSHDSICGWISSSALGRGLQFQSTDGDGFGGLDAHVQALNADRALRDLTPVQAIHVDPWPLGASAESQKEQYVNWLDDEQYEEETICSVSENTMVNDDDECETDGDDFTDPEGACDQIGGARIPKNTMYEKVAVGGTFDGMHYGHRKLLTLAVSSVNPYGGQLLIGVTVDAMLQHKKFAEEIPPLAERMAQAKEFVYRLAPGIKNRVRLVAISDEYGPPGREGEGQDFDALVLSHETLENGSQLNQHRTQVLGYEPLNLLCTRRTEPHGMSSTALRRIRSQRREKKKADASTKI